MTIRTIRHATIGGTGPYYAFFRSDSTFTDYTTDRVELTQVGSTGMYTGSWDDTDGLTPFIFQGSATPTQWSQAVAFVDFTQDQIVSTQTSHTNQLAFILADTTEALTRVLTVDQLAAMVSILGIPSSGSTPDTPTAGVLAEILERALLIGTATAFTPSPVISGTQLTRLIIGDDYLTEHNRQLTFTRTLTITPASTTLQFTKVMACGGTPETWTVTGSASVSDGVLTCVFQINAADWSGVTAGTYSWIVEVVDNDGDVVTAINSLDQRVPYVEFQEVEGR